MTNTTNSKLTYEAAGVNIDAGNALVEQIKSSVKKTNRPGVLGSLGGFGGLFELPWQDYKQPVLVSGTDGVGSKLLLAKQANRFNDIGIDLVAMCVNDVIVCGSEPLFFLDYYACGQLQVEQASSIIDGIAKGCQQANIALIGGETAELPGMYHNDDYDLAGFCVGIVEKDRIIDGSQVKSGQALIALSSSGPHANGYSLIRAILTREHLDIHSPSPFSDMTLADELLAPTRIYVKSILALQKQMPIHAMAHITGGGLLDNIPRVLPSHLSANIDLSSWQRPAVFDWLQAKSHLDDHELLRTFNAGVGMVICIDQHAISACLDTLAQLGENAWHIGNITECQGDHSAVNLIS